MKRCQAAQEGPILQGKASHSPSDCKGRARPVIVVAVCTYGMPSSLPSPAPPSLPTLSLRKKRVDTGWAHHGEESDAEDTFRDGAGEACNKCLSMCYLNYDYFQHVIRHPLPPNDCLIG